MTMTTTQALRFRQTKKGEWVAFGPISRLHTGPCAVAKRDGSARTVTVERIGRAFAVDGVDCAYGYLADNREPQAPRATGTDGGASEKQLCALRKMAARLDRIDQFDSFHGNGQTVAVELRQAAADSTLSLHKASELIDMAADLIDDET